jgi:hypothetical protein
MRDPVTVAGGKYTFFIAEDGLLDCRRHGEPWPAFREVGRHLHRAQLALYYDMVEARQQLANRKPISERNRRRLRDGIDGLETASNLLSRAANDLIPGPSNQDRISDARRALQSLDDLGYPELNELVMVVTEFLGRVGK